MFSLFEIRCKKQTLLHLEARPVTYYFSRAFSHAFSHLILVFLPRQCFSHLFLILFHPWLVKRVHAHQISSYGAGCFEEVDQLAKVIGSQLRNIYLYHWNTNSFMSCHYAADCRLVDLVHAFTRKHLASTVRNYNILIRMKHI